MNHAAVLIAAKLRIARNQIASVRHESKLKVGVVSVAAVLLWIGAFYAFYRGFLWLRAFGIDPSGQALSLGDIIMVRLLSVFALALFLMLVFSNVLISYSTIYRSREIAYLVQAPVPVRAFFVARFAECVSFSSWASAYLGSPLILAYGITTTAPWPFYLAAAAFYVPYVAIPAAIGSLITMILVRVFPRLPRGAIIILGAVAVAILFVFIRGRFGTVEITDDTFLPTMLDAMQRTQSSFLPSYWATRGVLDAAEREYAASLFYFLLLTSNALMATWVAAEAAQRMFYTGWTTLVGDNRARKRAPGRGLLGQIDGFVSFLREPNRSLVLKDIRLFWRDPTQWSQFILFFGIMAIYIANLRNRGVSMQNETYRNWIVCLNIGACTLILATLTSRFVFPLVSLEGRRIWILGLSPVTFRQIMWQKFWLSVSTTSVFTITLVVLSCIRLEVEPVPFVLAVYSIVITNFGLSGLAVGLGSLYPNFEEDNPARIVSGMGGTLNFLLSMGYLALVVGAETLILQWRVLERFATPQAFWWALGFVFLFVTGLSALAMLAPMAAGLRNLEQTEF